MTFNFVNLNVITSGFPQISCNTYYSASCGPYTVFSYILCLQLHY